jgi:hypothetical protein
LSKSAFVGAACKEFPAKNKISTIAEQESIKQVFIKIPFTIRMPNII